jgi:hypothetical protein
LLASRALRGGVDARSPRWNLVPPACIDKFFELFDEIARVVNTCVINFYPYSGGLVAKVFVNGVTMYSFSIVMHSFSYGANSGLFELAVESNFNGRTQFCHIETFIPSIYREWSGEVIGWLSIPDVISWMYRIFQRVGLHFSDVMELGNS